MQEKVSTSESALLAQDQARLNAMVKGDYKTLDGLFHSGLKFTHSNGILDTKQAYVEKIKAGSAYVVAERRDVEVHVRGEVGWMTGGVHLGVQRGDKPRVDLELRYTAVWVLEGGKWLLASYTSTPAPKAA